MNNINIRDDDILIFFDNNLHGIISKKDYISVGKEDYLKWLVSVYAISLPIEHCHIVFSGKDFSSEFWL